MDVRTYIGALGFVPKDGTNGVYQKIYTTQNNYTIEVDFNKPVKELEVAEPESQPKAKLHRIFRNRKIL